ncbi:MAG: acyl carrier protein [Clostridia bacterium]
MSEKEIFQKLKTIVVDQLGVNEENVTMEATFVDDLAADSLDIVELIMNIEEEFDLEIPDNDTEKIVTIGDVVKYIEEHK